MLIQVTVMNWNPFSLQLKPFLHFTLKMLSSLLFVHRENGNFTVLPAVVFINQLTEIVLLLCVERMLYSSGDDECSGSEQP